MRHLLQISDLSSEEIHHLIVRANDFMGRADHLSSSHLLLAGKTVVNLFCETSTRTRVSFELAAKRLGATVVNIQPARSSLQKNESMLDTLLTLQAMACDYFVMRHNQEGIVQDLADRMGEAATFINAGDGIHAHPSQALLDVLTIAQHKKDFTCLSVAIVGDVLHSRVAHSDLEALRLLGVRDIRVVAPDYFMEATWKRKGVTLESNVERGLSGVDVMILLRIQKERLAHDDCPDIETYRQAYGVNEQRVALAKPDVIVLHPGPMNRGIEIEDAVASGKHSVITQQVKNGVAMRMAILAELAGR